MALLKCEILLGSEETRLEMRSLTAAWTKRATEKLGSAANDHEREMYAASRRVNLVAFQRAERRENFKHTFNVAICYGLDLQIKAFAYIKRHETKYLLLNYLASDPNSLGGGVGAKLIQFLCDKAKGKFAGIFVEPLEGARPYFQKLGFVPCSTRLVRSTS